MNLCCACNEDFGSVRLFDRHRVGVHEYTYEQGLERVPPVSNGRRCLSKYEMELKGWTLDAKNRWVDPAQVERAREAFAGR